MSRAIRQELFAISASTAGSYQLEGELSFDSVELALKKTAKFFISPAQMVFDLAGVSKADSAGLALLLEWLRQAATGGVELRYVNLPRQLLAMAQVVGVEDILIIDSATQGPA
jgi:phospholipid transport system transporter-binding protein